MIKECIVLTMLTTSLSVVAAPVLGAENPVRLHGYGELHYNNSDLPDTQASMDNHRLVLGWSYTYTKRITLNAEVDFEHAAQEMELEFAFIDFKINDKIGIRAGTMLMPVGYLNENHEPPRFYSVERPYVQKNIIPTTWQEGGAGLFGAIADGVRYRVYLVSGLNAQAFTAKSGIRKGRGKVAESPSSDLAVVGRFEYERLPELLLGISAYNGKAAQDNDELGDASVSLLETDARYRLSRFELTGLYIRGEIDGTKRIYETTGQVIGETLMGGYFEAAYHARGIVIPENMDIVLFARREQYNTQHRVASGFNADPANDLTVTTVGLSFFPDKKIAVKADLESWEDGNGKHWRQFNCGLGYMF